MNYYTLSTSTNKREIGCYPQCKGLPEGYTVNWFNNPNSMTKITNNDFPIQDPELIFELEEKAILTDVISPSNISAQGLLVNEKAKDLINKYMMKDTKIYPAYILFGNKKIQYYWIHFVKRDLIGIDLEKSILYKSNFGMDKQSYIKIHNYENGLEIIRKDNCFIKFEKIIISTAFINFFNELFYLPIPNTIIASENLATIINNSKITGITSELVC